MFKIIDIIIACFALVFFQGIAVISGIPSLGYQLIIDIIIIILFLHATIFSSSIKNAPGMRIFILFTAFWIISSIYFQSDMFTAYRFYRNTFIPYLFFIAVLNLPINENGFLKIDKFIFTLLIIQIFAAVVKFILFGGVHEGTIIGTFDESGSGTYSTILPVLVTIFLLSFYYVYSKKRVYLFLMAGFFFFAWGGGKRAFVFIFPVFIFLFYYMYNKIELNKSLLTKKSLSRLRNALIISIPILYLFVCFTPSLNPENKYGGSFDIKHIYDYTSFYYFGYHQETGQRYGGQSVLLGRKATLMRALELTTSDIDHFFLGYGPSSIYASSRGDSRLMGFGVAAFQTGFAYYIMAMGIPGAIILIFLYLKLGRSCLIDYHSSVPYWRALKIGVFCSIFVLFFDYFLYSPIFVKGFLINICFFYFAASAIKHRKVTYLT